MEKVEKNRVKASCPSELIEYLTWRYYSHHVYSFHHAGFQATKLLHVGSIFRRLYICCDIWNVTIRSANELWIDRYALDTIDMKWNLNNRQTWRFFCTRKRKKNGSPSEMWSSSAHGIISGIKYSMYFATMVSWSMPRTAVCKSCFYLYRNIRGTSWKCTNAISLPQRPADK